MDGQLKPRVTAKLDYERARPPSPYKAQVKSLSPPPVIRPRAKVNSSATPLPRKLQASTSAGSTVGSPGASTIARPPSPSKIAQLRSAPGVLNAHTVKARLTTRPNDSQRTPPTETRQRALTTTPSETSLSARINSRRGSASSHTSGASRSDVRSLSPLAQNRVRTTASENGSFSAQTPPPLRVKSKISKLSESNVPSPLTPPNQVNRQTHGRVPSIGSLSPLVTAISPAPYGSGTLSHPASADRARFATTRESHAHKPHLTQPFPSNDDLAVRYGGYAVHAKVDPASIPLPPQSPPTSTLSFSSRSSASRSSTYDTQSTSARSAAPTINSRINGNGNGHILTIPDISSSPPSDTSALDRDVGLHSRDTSHPSDDEDVDDDLTADSFEQDAEDSFRKQKAAAKSNRKIADLEITNRSLLAINASLEGTKHRQAKEIRDLRRKLRESRLILPPPAYQAVKSSLQEDDTAEEDDEEDEEDEEPEGQDDEAFTRVKGMIEGLLDSCKRALESKPEDFITGSKGTAKVLSAEEVRSWRGDDVDTRSIASSHLGLDAKSYDRPRTPSQVAMPDSDDSLTSEDEVELSLLEPDSPPSSSTPLPPIMITRP